MTKTKQTAGSRQRRAIGYIRVSREGGRSTKNGGESYRTKGMQQARIIELARLHSLTIVGWYVDENESGKSTNRPGFQQALTALEDKEADVLVVAKLSRFARSVQDTETTVARLDGIKASLICGDLPEMSGPWGKAFRQIMAIFAELELDLARETWADAQAEALADGVFPRSAPRGYVKDKRRKLVRDEKEAALVEALFIGRAAGRSWAELMRDWKAQGGRRITRSGLQSIISNRVYLGETILGDVTLPGAHEALVTVEQWEAAQDVKAPQPWRSRNGSLLAGLLTCSVCGRAMTSSGHAASGKTKASYRCQPGVMPGHRQSITQQYVDAVVEEKLLAWAGEKAYEGTPNGESGLVAAMATLEDARAELTLYVERTSVLVDADTFEAGVRSRQAAVDEAQAEVDRLRSSRKVESVRVRLVELWPDLETEERRKLLTQAVESIIVHPNTSGRSGGPASEEVRLAAVRARVDLTFRKDI